MMNYYEFDFDNVDQELNDQLIALLSNQGFEGFEEEEGTLLAFIAKDKFDENLFHETIAHFPQLSYTQTEIEQVNWNQQWEQGFQPVQVGSFAAVRAHFHAAIPEVKYDIVITPKMSFGTGHHPTTYLMMEQMESIDFKNKSVFDFGTGTGVLAILAEKLGATAVLAIDNDEWSINNAQENVAMNHCSTITLALGECPPDKGAFDIILANITLNVISAHINALVGVAKKGAAFVFSGFLYTDEAKISAVLKQAGLTVQSFHRRGDWLTAAAIY